MEWGLPFESRNGAKATALHRLAKLGARKSRRPRLSQGSVASIALRFAPRPGIDVRFSELCVRG